jgi:hypothetical protein
MDGERNSDLITTAVVMSKRQGGRERERDRTTAVVMSKRQGGRERERDSDLITTAAYVPCSTTFLTLLN